MRRTLVTISVVIAAFLAFTVDSAQGQRRSSRRRPKRARPALQPTAEQKADALNREARAVSKWLKANGVEGKKVIGSLIGEAIHARMEGFRKEMAKRHDHEYKPRASKVKEMVRKLSPGAQRVRNWLKTNPEMGKKVVAALWKEKMAEGKKKIEAHIAKVREHRSEAKPDHHKSGYKHPGKDPHKRMKHHPRGRHPSHSGWGRGRGVSHEKAAEVKKSKSCDKAGCKGHGKAKVVTPEMKKTSRSHSERFEAFRNRMADLHKHGFEARKAHAGGAKKPAATAKPVRRPHTRTRTAPVKAAPTRDAAATNKRIDELSNQIDRLIDAAQKIQHELKELKK